MRDPLVSLSKTPNSLSAGCRITQVKDASNGNVAESYGYDNGGRVTSITRDGAARNLGYNTADQLTGYTNSTAGSWVTYLHDATGRRTVSTNSAGVVRRFLVASTPETDLESPQLDSDGGGTLKQGYVYVGRELLRTFLWSYFWPKWHRRRFGKMAE